MIMTHMVQKRNIDCVYSNYDHVAPLPITKTRENMKKIAHKLILISAPLYFYVGNAMATSCGPGSKFGPCPTEVPEPSTPYLFIAAIGVAVAVAKFRKKK